MAEGAGVGAGCGLRSWRCPWEVEASGGLASAPGPGPLRAPVFSAEHEKHNSPPKLEGPRELMLEAVL